MRFKIFYSVNVDEHYKKEGQKKVKHAPVHEEEEKEHILEEENSDARSQEQQGFLDSRLGWHRIFGHLIPKHANSPAFTFGGMIVFLGIVQAITGIILQQFYVPLPGNPGAYDSVVQMARSVDLSFVRNLHYWGAQLLIILALLHMTRVFISGAYKKPREFQWLSGLVLLVIVFAFSYTGTVLKGDQEGIEAFGHQTETGEILGPIGSILELDFLPGVAPLTRLFALHVTVIPILAVPVLALHFILIRINNISIPRTIKNNRLTRLAYTKVPFSTHIIALIEYGAVVTAIVIILSVVLPAPLYQRGQEGIEITKPPWYLIWLYPLEDIFGVKAIAITSTLMFALLAAVPLFDRKQVTDPRMRKRMIAGMFVLIAFFAILLITGSLVPATQHHD